MPRFLFFFSTKLFTGQTSWLRLSLSVSLSVFLSVLLAVSLTVVLGNSYRQTYLVLNVASSQQASLHVYFKTGKAFQEKHSVTKRAGAGDTAQLLYFPVPTQRISSVRLDPETDADIRILDMMLVDKRAALITQIDPADLVALHNVAIVPTAGQGVQIITQGADPQVLLDDFPRLPNRYGFKPLFALTLTCVVYCILQLVFLLFCAAVRNKEENTASGSSWSHSLHLFIIVLGGAGLAGGVLLWNFEGRTSLGEDQGEDQEHQGEYQREYQREHQGKHDLVPYISNLSAQPVTFTRQSDNLSLAGLLYKPSTRTMAAEQPAVLLLHGNYPQGSRFPLYQVMAEELARRGYVVLAMDFAGYGGSADPFAAGSVEGFDLNADAVSGLQFLQRQSGVDGNRLHVAGHSMGADPAISAGSTTDSVRSIALIGPPRRVHERFNYQPDVDFFWNWAFHVRETVYQKTEFPDWFNKEFWRQQILKRDMVHFLPYFAQRFHKPVLFLDGEREIEPDRKFLQWYSRRTSWPKQYVTLNKANHDCNVTARHDRIYYDQAVMEQTIDTLDQWFRRAEKKQPQPLDLLLNLLRRLFAVEMLTGC